jgi:hypothetical protein
VAERVRMHLSSQARPNRSITTGLPGNLRRHWLLARVPAVARKQPYLRLLPQTTPVLAQFVQQCLA